MFLGRDTGHGMLAAVLLNPPLNTTGVRTRRAVDLARKALGCLDVEITNLNAFATASVVDLNDEIVERGWLEARTTVANAIQRADVVLGAWGVAGLTGAARRARDDQVDWLSHYLQLTGHEVIWMVGGAPRHPSRWHQYVSDKYGRTTGGNTGERLADVLRAVPVSTIMHRARCC